MYAIRSYYAIVRVPGVRGPSVREIAAAASGLCPPSTHNLRFPGPGSGEYLPGRRAVASPSRAAPENRDSGIPWYCATTQAAAQERAAFPAWNPPSIPSFTFRTVTPSGRITVVRPRTSCSHFRSLPASQTGHFFSRAARRMTRRAVGGREPRRRGIRSRRIPAFSAAISARVEPSRNNFV